MVLRKDPILFITNPSSGRASRKLLEASIEKHLDTNKYDPEVVEWVNTDSTESVIDTRLKQGVKKVVAVGGDGTVNLVGSHLVNTGACLGIIPMGSGNGLARHLKIPLSPAKSMRLLNKDRTMMIDYCTANGTPFFCTAGVGFDAHVGDRFNRQTKRGFFTYLRTTVSEYGKYKAQEYRMLIDNQPISQKAFVIGVANSSQYGNNAYIAPQADITDGMINITIISPFPNYIAPSLALKLFSQRITSSKWVETYRTSKFTIESEQETLAHFDGETQVFKGNLTFECKHLGLNVII